MRHAPCHHVALGRLQCQDRLPSQPPKCPSWPLLRLIDHNAGVQQFSLESGGALLPGLQRLRACIRADGQWQGKVVGGGQANKADRTAITPPLKCAIETGGLVRNMRMCVAQCAITVKAHLTLPAHSAFPLTSCNSCFVSCSPRTTTSPHTKPIILCPYIPPQYQTRCTAPVQLPTHPSHTLTPPSCVPRPCQCPPSHT